LRIRTHTPLLQKPPAAPDAQSPSTVQPVLHAAEVPEQRPGAHSAGDAVFGSTVHVPFAVAPRATEQTSHEPEHAESQHTPSTHAPVAHCRPRVHAPPFASCTTHAPAVLQNAFGAQLVSAVHEVAHVPEVPVQV
jgi:hypothetical protein